MDQPNAVSWTSDEIARFWDYWSAKGDSQETYFALQVGAGVAQFAEYVRSLSQLDVLDFGSGPGHLVPHLLKRGANVTAVDHSPNSVAEVSQRFRGQSGWIEARTFENDRLPWEANSFDAAFCLETIEHLHHDDCSHIFSELHRVLRPEGFIVYTTPNEEDLSKQQVYCPCCHSEFHRWQHLRSWSADQLTERLQAHGYSVPFCRGVNFRDFQPPSRRKNGLGTLRRQLRSAVLGWLDAMAPRAFPNQRALRRRLRKSTGHHLVAIAVKTAATAHGGNEPLQNRAA